MKRDNYAHFTSGRPNPEQLRFGAEVMLNAALSGNAGGKTTLLIPAFEWEQAEAVLERAKTALVKAERPMEKAELYVGCAEHVRLVHLEIMPEHAGSKPVSDDSVGEMIDELERLGGSILVGCFSIRGGKMIEHWEMLVMLRYQPMRGPPFDLHAAAMRR